MLTMSNDTQKTERSSLEGWSPDLNDPQMTLDALEKAFDYRGDVTVQLRSGETITGYIFDRRTGQSLDDSTVRLMPEDGSPQRSICYRDVTGLQFTGKDTAHGKTWENWLKRYAEKRAKGESTDLLPETLD